MSALLKKEAGVIPARSRRCDGEMFREKATGFNPGRRESLLNQSQKTCLYFIPTALRAIGEVEKVLASIRYDISIF